LCPKGDDLSAGAVVSTRRAEEIVTSLRDEQHLKDNNCSSTLHEKDIVARTSRGVTEKLLDQARKALRRREKKTCSD
jgi:hypothetical protein